MTLVISASGLASATWSAERAPSPAAPTEATATCHVDPGASPVTVHPAAALAGTSARTAVAGSIVPAAR